KTAKKPPPFSKNHPLGHASEGREWPRQLHPHATASGPAEKKSLRPHSDGFPVHPRRKPNACASYFSDSRLSLFLRSCAHRFRCLRSLDREGFRRRLGNS